MWCGNCQQDVPAVASGAEAASICCARCGDPFPRPPARDTASEAGPLSMVDFPQLEPPPATRSLLDWKLEDELREAERLVQLVRSQSGETAKTCEASAPPASSAAQPSRNTRAGLLTWLLSGLGLAGLVCGCSLLIWSLISGREELWAWGLPTALVSQVVLFCATLLRRDGKPAETTAAATTLVQMQSSTGQMQPSGLSVYFTPPPAGSSSVNPDALRQEIEAAMRRNRAA